jgi:hypothetical protein
MGADSLLRVSDRTFRRNPCRNEENGLEGQIDHRLEQMSHRRAAVDEVMWVTDQYRIRHTSGSAKHFSARDIERIHMRNMPAIQAVLANLAAFLATLKAATEQLTDTQQWRAILSHAFAQHVLATSSRNLIRFGTATAPSK